MLFGLSIATWISLVPRIVALVKFFVALVIGYSVLNKTTPVQTAIWLLENLEEVIPKPEKFSEWSQEDLNRYWKRSSGLESDQAEY